MPLSDIVNVTIDRQTQAIPEMSFGLPMILGTSKSFVDLIRQYTSLSGVAEDFTPSQPEYIAAASIFSQKRSPQSIFIGRRNADLVTMTVVSPQNPATYTTTVNGLVATVSAATATQNILISLSTPYNAGNLTNVKFNNVVLGTINSVIDFDIDFVALNSIVATVNGVALAPVVFLTDQATTIGLLATAIAGAAGVASATVTAAREITVVFTSPGANTVTSVITTLGASQPVATILQGGFPYDTSSAVTLGNIAAAIALQPNVTSATVVGNTIEIVGTGGALNSIQDFSIFIGTLPVVTITIDSLAATIAKNMVTAIAALSPAQPVKALYTGTPDGTYTVAANVSGVPFTITVGSDIVTPASCYVEVTNVVPVESYTLTLNGTPYTYTTTDSIQTAEQIVAQLVLLVNANTVNSNIVAVDNLDGSFTLTGALPFSIFFNAELFAVVKGIRMLPLVATDVIGTTLTAIKNVNSQWYGLIVTDRTKSVVEAAMVWAEANGPVLFATASNDPVIINSPVGTDITSVAWYAQNHGFVRSFVMYHQDADTDYPEAAWMGLVFTMTPGSETWKFKNLQGVATSSLTTNQSKNALNKNANTYEFIGGVGITQNGTTGQGEFIDIIRGVDWLANNIQIAVYSILVQNPKVPYTDSGIALVQAQVQKSLQTGIDNNFLSDNPAPVVTVPLAANVPAIDKANRILRNVNFTATLAGAIHVVEINGVVTV